MNNAARALAQFIIRFRYAIIVGTILAVAGFAFCIQFLNFENDMTFWVDKNSSIGKMPHYINETFGNATPLLVAIDTDDFFTGENLGKLRTLTDKLAEIDHVSDVVALSTVDDFVPIQGGILVEKLLPRGIPMDAASLASLRSRILGKKNFIAHLVSKDGKATLVVVRLDFGVQADKIAAEVRRVCESVFTKDTATLYFSGNTFLLNAMASIVISDFVFLIPMVTLLVILVLFLSFRSLRGILLPLLTVLFSTTLMMGIMSVLNVPLNVMSSAVPVILIAVGSAYGIHVINNYNEQIRSIKDKEKIIIAVLKDVGVPVIMAGLTTMAGFLSNITAEVRIIRIFGIFTAIGVFFAVVIALLFIPAVLYILKVNPPKSRRKQVQTPVNQVPVRVSLIEKFATAVIKRKIVVLVSFGAVLVVCGIFASFITSKVDMLAYFSKDSEPQEASRFVIKNFGGFNPVNIYIKADATDPDVLKTVMLLEERIKAYDRMPAPSSPVGMISELNNAMTGFYTIPETKPEVENLLFFVEGNAMLSGMMQNKNTEMMVSALVPSIENTYLEGLFADIQSFLDRFKHGIRIEENNPRHPALLEAENLMIHNLLKDEQIRISDSDLEHTVRALSDAAATYVPKQDLSRVYQYALSDEAEIILEDDEAGLLVRNMERLHEYDLQSVMDAVRKSFIYPADISDQEIESFSTSVLQRIQESGENKKLVYLESILKEHIPAIWGVSQTAVAYTLAPFLWKTIPVNTTTTGSRWAMYADSKGYTSPGTLRTAMVQDMEITGAVKLIEDMRKSIFFNQITSILIALFAVLLLNTITFRSIKEGLVSLAAIITTIIINFGIMGIFSIPLDFVTALIAGVAIGTGIDYTIHFITRFSSEMKQGNTMVIAYKNTLMTAGKGILFNAIAVALGFAVLLGSNVIPMRTAGILLASTMATSSVCALTLMPALLAITGVIEKRRAGSQKSDESVRVLFVKRLVSWMKQTMVMFKTLFSRIFGQKAANTTDRE